MKYFKTIITLHFLLFIIACNSTAQTTAQTVNADTFEKGITEKEVQILDVRTPEEFNQGHLSNAMLANWNEKEEFIRRIDALDKDEPVYIYCLSGGRSAAAANLLREKGFSQITELQGGINAWKQGDKPMEGETAIEQISNESYLAMLTSSSLVLVDFGATWCPPCRKMEPILKEIEEENPTVTLLKIDGGSQSTLMKTHRVFEMPTYILYKDAKEVWRGVGFIDKNKISNALERFK
jgi:rhodanese-related sulfurtransferase